MCQPEAAIFISLEDIRLKGKSKVKEDAARSRIIEITDVPTRRSVAAAPQKSVTYVTLARYVITDGIRNGTIILF